MHITVADVQAYLDPTKAQITALDTQLELNQSDYVLGRLSDTFSDPSFGVSTWTDSTNTPALVKQCIAMFYGGWYYDRTYSEAVTNESTTSYGAVLRSTAEQLLQGITRGSIILPEIGQNAPATAPVFYPDDTSSTTDARQNNTDPDDNSLGPAMFGVSKLF